MIELVVGVVALYGIIWLGFEVDSLNRQIAQVKTQRNSAYANLTKLRNALDESEEYIDKLEGISNE